MHDTIGASPFGFYCKHCKKSLQDISAVHDHLRQKHRDLVDATTLPNRKKILVEMKGAADNTNINSWLIGTTKAGLECSVCAQVFVNKFDWIFERHIRNRKGACDGAIPMPITYKDTMCFRQHRVGNLIPVQPTNVAIEEPVPRAPVGVLQNQPPPNHMSFSSSFPTRLETCKMAFQFQAESDSHALRQSG